MCVTAAVRQRCFGRESERDATGHRTDEGGMAGHQNHPAGRFRVLPEPVDELVRIQQSGHVFGLARNQRLLRIIGREMWEATEEWKRTGKPARVFAEFS